MKYILQFIEKRFATKAFYLPKYSAIDYFGFCLLDANKFPDWFLWAPRPKLLISNLKIYSSFLFFFCDFIRDKDFCLALEVIQSELPLVSFFRCGLFNPHDVTHHSSFPICVFLKTVGTTFVFFLWTYGCKFLAVVTDSLSGSSLVSVVLGNVTAG